MHLATMKNQRVAGVMVKINDLTNYDDMVTTNMDLSSPTNKIGYAVT